MPLSSNQLAVLVARAREKAPPVVAPPPPAVSRRKVPDKPAQPPKPVAKAIPAQPSPAMPAEPPTYPTPATPIPHGRPETSPDDFPIGWELKKDSGHFHRRFYAIFRRRMWHGRAPVGGLLARQAAGQQRPDAPGPRHALAADHHLAEALAATGPRRGIRTRPRR